MFAVFPGSRPLTFCRDYAFATICAVLGCFLGNAAFAAPGQLDATFGNDGKVATSIVPASNALSAMAEQSDGKVIAVGSCLAQGKDGFYSGDFCLARYQANGSLDSSFGDNGKVLTAITTASNDAPSSVAVQPDGKIVLAGSCRSGVNGRNVFCVARYLPEGTFDATFNGVGTTFTNIAAGAECNVGSVVITIDGNILAAGSCSVPAAASFAIVRYRSNGETDSTFGTQGILLRPMIDGQFNHISRIALQADGRLVAAGSCGDNVGNSKFCALRFEADGLLDSSFGTGGVVSVAVGTDGADRVSGLRLQTDGKLLLGGDCRVGGNLWFCAARLLPDGALDWTFGGAGKAVEFVSPGATHYAVGISLLADGKLLVGGSCGYGSGSEICLLRLDHNGTLDATFGVGGRATANHLLDGRATGVTALLLKSDGKTVVGGPCGEYITYSFCLAQFKGGPYPPLTCALNIDANNAIESFADGLLIVRYVIGYRGNALTDGVGGTNPTRTGTALETHLASLSLDADGDGQALAMTDGLLLLRAMLGLTGDALTQGATNASHPNVRNAQQILTWIENTHGVACLP